MRKVFFLAAMAALFMTSCQKEKEIDLESIAKPEQTTSVAITFNATIEDSGSDSKGTINASHQLVWAESDQIGVYVSDMATKNQPFTLSTGAGTTDGTFSWDNTGDFGTEASAAYYPLSNNSGATGVVNFKLPDEYWSYSSGKMLTPLVASLSGSTDDIDFKHAGAAVKLTINNLPAHVYSVKMSVDGQQITGNFSINPANAGADALALVGESDSEKNQISLYVWNGSESAWDFVFPVPSLSKPKLSFEIRDENDIIVWNKNLKAQSSDLGRRDLLVMPPISITPYRQFSESPDWTFCGKINGCTATDIPMYTDGTVCILPGITFKAGDTIKVRKDKKDDEFYTASPISEATTKDVWFNISSKVITLVDAKCPYPAPKATLYFGMNSTPGTSGALSCSGLGLYGWPSVTFTEKEYIKGKCYYKYTIDARSIWGKTVDDMYVFGNGASWVTAKSSADFTTIKTEYYFEATDGASLEQLADRPTIIIDGDMSDWALLSPLASTGSSRIRDWKFTSDKENLFFYFRLRKNKMYSGYSLSIVFDWDGTGSYHCDNLAEQGELSIAFKPFTNGTAGTPVCVNGTISSAWINTNQDKRTAENATTGLSIDVYGQDPNPSATGDTADYYLEVCVPKSIVTGLPSSGSLNIGAGYEWYNTGYQSVTL